MINLLSILGLATSNIYINVMKHMLYKNIVNRIFNVSASIQSDLIYLFLYIIVNYFINSSLNLKIYHNFLVSKSNFFRKLLYYKFVHFDRESSSKIVSLWNCFENITNIVYRSITETPVLAFTILFYSYNICNYSFKLFISQALANILYLTVIIPADYYLILYVVY